MNVHKLDFKSYIKTGKFSKLLYLIALLLYLIPIFIVLIMDYTFSSSSNKIIDSIAWGFIIIGKTLTLLNKEKGDKTISIDIGILIGLIIAFIDQILK